MNWLKNSLMLAIMAMADDSQLTGLL